jgi:PAS domain S-box-containing protein
MNQAELTSLQTEKYPFLSGGGEMGNLIRSKDWSASLVGTPDSWPQSLRTTLSIILNSKFPMFLFWGPELVCFYNDAYRPSLGKEGKHPDILGSRGEDHWQEIWPVIKPLIDQVLAGGEATWSEDQLIPIYRNGNMEDVYWTFSYSPVNDESGKPAGVFVTCNETTEKINTLKSLQDSNSRYLNNIVQVPVAMCILRGSNHVVEIANEMMLNVWGKKAEDVMNKPLFEGLPEAKGQGFELLLDNVYNTGERFIASEHPTILPRDGKLETAYIDFVYEALRESDGTISGVAATATDVTLQINARKKLEANELKLNIVLDASELGTWEVDLSTGAIIYSDRIIEIAGYKKGTVLTHQEMLKQVHPDDLTIRENAFKEAFETGHLHYETRSIWPDGSIHWIETKGKVFFNEAGKPATMLGTARDITDRHLREENLARMAAIVQSSSDAIISKDLNGIIISWNAAAEQIFGYTEKEMIGQSVLKLIPADRIDEEASILMQIRSGERVNHFETKRITKYNEVLDISLTISPIRGIHGNIIGASKIARDITPEKEAKRLIAANEKKFQVLADSMPQFVWTADTAGNLNYFNQAVCLYSGLSKEQIKKEGWLQIIHPDDREANVKAWMHAVNTGTDFIFEHRFGRHDGEYRWQLSRAIPQKDAAGNIQMWVGTSTDIQEMKEQDQQKDFFISMASHELKTPVTSVKGYIQLLQSAYAKSEDNLLKQSLKVIDKQIVTLTSLITDLLDVSKIKSGSLVLNKQNFEITEMISEVVSQIQHVNPDHDISFIGNAATVFADRERISQVLINLLTNAVKYSPNSKKIIIKDFIEDDQVVLSVQDSGIGISKIDQEKIFERFYRVEGKDEKTYPGFGIGLFISSEIIQRHNGKIGVTSEPGKGSVFYFSIPLKK